MNPLTLNEVVSPSRPRPRKRLFWRTSELSRKPFVSCHDGRR